MTTAEIREHYERHGLSAISERQFEFVLRIAEDRATPDGEPSEAEFRADADYLARELLDELGTYALPVGHEDETHEDCVIRAATRVRAALAARPEPK